jgi:hypothetical protein
MFSDISDYHYFNLREIIGAVMVFCGSLCAKNSALEICTICDLFYSTNFDKINTAKSA